MNKRNDRANHNDRKPGTISKTITISKTSGSNQPIDQTGLNNIFEEDTDMNKTAKNNKTNKTTASPVTPRAP